MAEPKVAREVAETEFEKMCRARRVELDMSELTPEESKMFEKLKRKLIKAIMAGAVTVSEDGAPAFTAQSGAQKGKVFAFGAPTGAAVIAQDGKVGQARVFAALAEVTGKNVGEFGKLEVPDLEVTDALYLLFFQHASSI